jgi:hypothetical protein
VSSELRHVYDALAMHAGHAMWVTSEYVWAHAHPRPRPAPTCSDAESDAAEARRSGFRRPDLRRLMICGNRGKQSRTGASSWLSTTNSGCGSTAAEVRVFTGIGAAHTRGSKTAQRVCNGSRLGTACIHEAAV